MFHMAAHRTVNVVWSTETPPSSPFSSQVRWAWQLHGAPLPLFGVRWCYLILTNWKLRWLGLNGCDRCYRVSLIDQRVAWGPLVRLCRIRIEDVLLYLKYKDEYKDIRVLRIGDALQYRHLKYGCRNGCLNFVVSDSYDALLHFLQLWPIDMRSKSQVDDQHSLGQLINS